MHTRSDPLTQLFCRVNSARAWVLPATNFLLTERLRKLGLAKPMEEKEGCIIPQGKADFPLLQLHYLVLLVQQEY